jgi:TetR/AcrR family transcriptional repressor of nem operon
LDQFNHPAIVGLYKSVQGGEPPLDAIRAFFRQMAVAPDIMKRNGCFMGNALSGLSNIDAGLSDAAGLRLQALERLFMQLLEVARASGTLKNPTPSLVLARYLINLWNGLNITRRMYPEPSALLDLIELQLTLIH